MTFTDRHQLCPPMGLPILRLAGGAGWLGWLAGLTEVSEGRAATFPHPSAAAQQAVGPQPKKQYEHDENERVENENEKSTNTKKSRLKPKGA